MKRVLINAANLHTGGGVQVASSFLMELPRLLDRGTGCEVVVYASSAVDANLSAAGVSKTEFGNYRVVNVRGLEALRSEVAKEFYGFDSVFTIFGPLYLPRAIPNHIVGFAQSWIIYPDNEASQLLPFHSRWMLRLKFSIQWWFFSRSDRLVAELDHVKNGLVTRKSFPPERIDVVNNCVSAVFYNEPLWKEVPALANLEKDVIWIGYVTRDYPHKNLDFLIDVDRELKNMSPRRFRFLVTLTENEWSSRPDSFKDNVANVGPLSIAQCPVFYRAVHAVIFPSLLESFSVTPLEAMMMRRPIFASDRAFVRDCCGENALYFDPLEPRQAATRISEWFSNRGEQERKDHLERAYRHVMSLPDSKDRARWYLKIIDEQLHL